MCLSDKYAAAADKLLLIEAMKAGFNSVPAWLAWKEATAAAATALLVQEALQEANKVECGNPCNKGDDIGRGLGEVAVALTAVQVAQTEFDRAHAAANADRTIANLDAFYDAKHNLELEKLKRALVTAALLEALRQDWLDEPCEDAGIDTCKRVCYGAYIAGMNACKLLPKGRRRGACTAKAADIYADCLLACD